MGKPVKLPSGSWRIRFVNADGARESRTYATFDLARSELRRLEVEAEDKRVKRERDPGMALTVADAWRVFSSTRKPDPNNTERRFKARGDALARDYAMHIEPHLGSTLLGELSPARLRAWVATLAETPTRRPGEKNATGRTLSASRIRGIVTTLRQIATANDVPLVVKLADHLKQKRRRSRPRALQSIGDVRALLGACRDPWFKVAAAIACYCGARLGEVASLRWHHVSDSTITIALSWEGPLKHRYEDDDEEDAARVVPLAPELAEILAAWRTMTNGGPDDHVVLVRGERPLREGYDDVAQKTRSACKRAGLTPITFHSLRATYATLVADQGLPVSKLQALLGHADADTTAIYLRSESRRAALDPRAYLGGHAGDTTEPAAAETLN